jgi:tetratricopeptide (TPR) repeat protein
MSWQLHRIIGRDVCVTLLLAVMTAGAAAGSQQAATAASTLEQRLARVRADLFGASPRLDENIRELNAILAIDPRSAEAHLLLGIAHSALGKPEMVGEVKAEFQQALDLNPDLLPARLLLAQTYFDLGRFEKARDELQVGLARAPGQTQFMALLGETSRQMGDARRSVELNRKVLQIDPAMAQARYYLGLALIDLGQQEDGVQELETLVRRGAKVADVFLALGNAYLEAGRLDDAVSVLSEGVQIAPAAHTIRIPLARAYRLKGELARAGEQLTYAQPPASAQQAAAAYQKLEASLNTEWGALRLAEGRLPEAAAVLEKAIDMDPDHGPAHRYLAQVLFRQGLFSRSLQHAVQAEKLGTPLPPAERKALDAKIGKGGGR